MLSGKTIKIDMTSNKNPIVVKETIEDKETLTPVYFILDPVWAKNIDNIVPLYVQVSTIGDGLSNTQFELKLSEIGTNKIIFDKIKTTKSAMASYKAGCNIHSQSSYILEVKPLVKNIIKGYHWFTKKPLYKPTIKITCGPRGIKQVDKEF